MATRDHLERTGGPVLIGLGANLPSSRGAPRATCEAALEALGEAGVKVVRRSRWYRSAPLPPSPQPWFVNGVAAVETALDPVALLALLREIERRFGRVRVKLGEARKLDLDLLDYGGQVRPSEPPPELPHPRMHGRAFVLLPLAEVVPDWRHPRLGGSVEAMIDALPPAQVVEPLPWPLDRG